MMDIVDDAVLVLDVISRGLTFAKGERLVGIREGLSLVLCWRKKSGQKFAGKKMIFPLDSFLLTFDLLSSL